MSFFGFNTSLPRDRGHPTNAPGFGQQADPFASLSRPAEKDEDDDDDALEFEDTYDGLGDQLDETDDTFNDETFGGMPTVGQGPSSKPVGKDFDFFGQTAQVSDAINEEQLRYTRQQPSLRTTSIPAEPKIPSKPARTGYEKYNEPGYIPDLQANASLWGVTPKRVVADAGPSHQRQDSHGLNSAPGPTGVPARKMMSLEEVEAAMRAQSKKRTTIQDTATGMQMPLSMSESAQPVQTSPYIAQQPPQMPFQPQILQRQQQAVPVSYLAGQPHALGVGRSMQPEQGAMPSTSQAPPSQPQRYAQGREHSVQEQPPTLGPQTPTRQILQNPNRLSASHQRQKGSGPHEMPLNEAAPAPRQQGMARVQAPFVTHPQQLLQLSEEERAAFLMEDAKRAKRNHKIFLLSRGNGLMTPQDKNFITRIQLQQLVTATGNPNEAEGDSGMTEDFYYQVHSQIRGGPRQNPHQPLSNFAQTYLFQTGGRPGAAGSRRFNRAGDHHMQRMEQQVQRAVAAVKAKPKNKQLVLEGSLGKIAFSNAKTPKPLLNIKRVESGESGQRPGLSSLRLPSERRIPGSGVSTSDRKSVLRQIEDVYATLMQLENSERHLPPPPTEGSEATMIQAHMEWRRRMQQLNIELWTNLKVTDPIMPDSNVSHPFIALLSFAKGKKAIPRVFRHIDAEQRLTFLTMVIFHLNVLDVIRLAQLRPGETVPPATVREAVELFCQAVLPSLFGHVNEAPLQVVIGLMSLLLDRSDLRVVAPTKVGLSILTMLLSRAELVKQAGGVEEREWEQWATLYNHLFDSLEPLLATIFPSAPRSITSGEDMYVWQFLAAMGLGASADQQQRLVMGVKERVMETVVQARTLPAEMSAQRLGDVNLFMRAIGLDVELLA